MFADNESEKSHLLTDASSQGGEMKVEIKDEVSVEIGDAAKELRNLKKDDHGATIKDERGESDKAAGQYFFKCSQVRFVAVILVERYFYAKRTFSSLKILRLRLLVCDSTKRFLETNLWCEGRFLGHTLTHNPQFLA